MKAVELLNILIMTMRQTLICNNLQQLRH